ncbi:unnamed protein product, partial [Nesidiocoris tenuis]
KFSIPESEVSFQVRPQVGIPSWILDAEMEKIFCKIPQSRLLAAYVLSDNYTFAAMLEPIGNGGFDVLERDSGVDVCQRRGVVGLVRRPFRRPVVGSPEVDHVDVRRQLADIKVHWKYESSK